MEFCHVDHAGLELLASSDLPAAVSQSTGITDVSHHAGHFFFNYTDDFLKGCVLYELPPHPILMDGKMLLLHFKANELPEQELLINHSN